jgi:AbrB family looped-hinge helix DNA binding protein
MTTVLSKKGQLVLPAEVRKQLGLSAGDDFEVTIEDEQTIVLRRLTSPPNKGLVDILAACPHSFDVPLRARDDSRPVRL